MSKIITIVVLLFVACAYTQNLSERHYKSTDEATGGFYIFSLDLFYNGKLELTLEVSIQAKQSEEGEEWETSRKHVTGKWNRKDETITYSFDESKPSIDSIFINTDFSNINKPVITFSQKYDTAYVYGIPCVLVDNK